MSSPIRFAIVGAPTMLERWQYGCVKQLLTLPDVTAAAWLDVTALSSRPPDGRLFRRIWPNSAREHQHSCVASCPELAEVPRVPLQRQRLQEQLAPLELDFILSFDCPGNVHVLAPFARQGLWAYCFGDWADYRGGPPGFWEVYHRKAVTGAMLLRLRPEAGTASRLREGYFRTKPRFEQNRQHLLSRIGHWPRQVVIDLRNGVTGRLEGPVWQATRPLRGSPGMPHLLTGLIRTVGWMMKAVSQKVLRREQWNIGIVRQPIADFLDPKRKRAPVQWLPALPRYEFIADPFAIEHEGRLTLLCEHLDYRDERGVIRATASPGFASLDPVEIGPERPVHLSYPYVFEQEGRWYCMPEMHQAKQVALYEAVEFPRRWVKVATLLDPIEVVDTTLVRHGGLWWLLAADPGVDAPSADLFVWYAEHFKGPWHPHPGNPVKTDVRSARPAGRPFTVNGVLYRPTQDCSESYGGRVIINRMVKLTPLEFEEESVAIVEADPNSPYPDGLHTLCGVGDVTVIDSKRRVFAYFLIPGLRALRDRLRRRA